MPTLPNIILASTSPYRRQLLERLGLPFEQRAPDCDEDALKTAGLAPRELAETLGRLKAESIAQTEPNAVVIGSDQLAHCDGRILGKPGNAEKAVNQLEFLAGRTHQLITAVTVCYQGAMHQHTDITTLSMRTLTREQLTRYVAADQPYNCAGAYKLECQGIGLFETIASDDHSAITGLPLLALTTLLSKCGCELF